MDIGFPYRDVPGVRIPERNLLGVYAPRERSPRASVTILVREALASPLGSPPLRDLARGARRVLLVVDDTSRPTPVHAIIPGVLEELRAAGVDQSRIEILLALGTHRFMTPAEIAAKIGEEVAARFPVHNHDWTDPGACTLIGTTADGVEVWMNRRVVEADLVIGIGLIMPIDICGFTGGGKILVPGACGKVTNDEMHWKRIDEPDENVLGRRDNRVRAAIDEMARKAGLRFIVNVILDPHQRVLEAVAGDMVEAHRHGAEIARDVYSVAIPREADIVVADSYPFDIDFWQANKALDQAGLVVRKGGALVLVTPCTEGLSVTHRELAHLDYPPREEIKRMVDDGAISSKVVAVHMAQVSKVAREKATVILVTDGIDPADVRRIGLEYAATPQEGLARAFEIAGENAAVAVLRGAAQMLPVVG
jgi:nickel-dependent lactate racemase